MKMIINLKTAKELTSHRDIELPLVGSGSVNK